eukprot:TCONS_00014160-protein
MGVNDYIFSSLYAVLFLIGFFGNIIVIFYYGFIQRRSSNAHQVLKIHLALADLLVCTFVPVHMYEDYVLKRHIQNTVYRYVTAIPMYVAVTVSAWVMCCMSYERYRKITRPFAEPISKTKVCLVCACLWLICMPLGFEGVLEIEMPELLNDRTFFYFHIVLLFIECIFPILFMTWCYRKIEKTVRTAWVTLRIRRQQNEIALKTLKHLVWVFAVCVTPGRFLLVVLNVVAGWTLANRRSVALTYSIQFAGFLFYINNAVNCLIYVSQDKKFRYWLSRQKEMRRRFSIFRKNLDRKDMEELHMIALMMGRRRDKKSSEDNTTMSLKSFVKKTSRGSYDSAAKRLSRNSFETTKRMSVTSSDTKALKEEISVEI